MYMSSTVVESEKETSVHKRQVLKWNVHQNQSRSQNICQAKRSYTTSYNQAKPAVPCTGICRQIENLQTNFLSVLFAFTSGKQSLLVVCSECSIQTENKICKTIFFFFFLPLHYVTNGKFTPPPIPTDPIPILQPQPLLPSPPMEKKKENRPFSYKPSNKSTVQTQKKPKKTCLNGSMLLFYGYKW